MGLTGFNRARRIQAEAKVTEKKHSGKPTAPKKKETPKAKKKAEKE